MTLLPNGWIGKDFQSEFVESIPVPVRLIQHNAEISAWAVEFSNPLGVLEPGMFSDELIEELINQFGYTPPVEELD